MALRQPRILEVGLLIDIEVDVYGIKRNQSRQGLDLPSAALDQIAFRDLRPSHATRNRSRDPRELQIQFRATKRRFRGRDASFGFVANCGPPVVLFG